MDTVKPGEVLHLFCKWKTIHKIYIPISEEEGGSEIHMMWSEKVCNTACWNDGFLFIEAVRSPKIECYVANHQWIENDCIFSDIILPVTTKVEDNDIGSRGDGCQYTFVAYEKRAVQPVGESKSDYEIAVEIAKKLGVEEEVTEGKSIDEWIEYGYENSGIKDMISLEKLKENGYYIVPVSPNWKEVKSGLIDFYNDPVKNPLGTPSGKLEFYSDRLAENFPEDNERGPMPKWVIGGPSLKGGVTMKV
jgi:trimethylamine-N-oxide reductase (cytochrome c)